MSISHLHPEADIAVEGVAAADTGEVGGYRGFAEERIFVIVPVVGAADADAAAQRIVGLGQIEPGQVGDGAAGKVVIEVGDAIEMRAGVAFRVVGLVVDREPKPANEALALRPRNR